MLIFIHFLTNFMKFLHNIASLLIDLPNACNYQNLYQFIILLYVVYFQNPTLFSPLIRLYFSLIILGLKFSLTASSFIYFSFFFKCWK